MEYFNYISQENESIDTAMDFYFVRNTRGESRYTFIVSPQLPELMRSDAVTGCTEFYRIERSTVLAHESMFFPDGFKRLQPLFLNEFEHCFKKPAQDTHWQKFGSYLASVQPVRQHIQILLDPSYDEINKCSYLYWLTLFCAKDTSKKVFYALDGINALIQTMKQSRSYDLLFRTAVFLELLATHSFVQNALCNEDSIDILVNLLVTTKNIELQQSLGGTLVSVSNKKDSHKLLCKAANMSSVVALTKKTQDIRLSFLLSLLFIALAGRKNNYTDLLKLNIVPLLIDILASDKGIDFKQAAMDHLFKFSSEIKGRALIQQDNGFGAVLDILCHSDNAELKKSAFKLIGNLIFNSENMSFFVIFGLTLFLYPRVLKGTPTSSFLLGATIAVATMIATSVISKTEIKIEEYFKSNKENNLLMFSTAEKEDDAITNLNSMKI